MLDNLDMLMEYELLTDDSSWNTEVVPKKLKDKQEQGKTDV